MKLMTTVEIKKSMLRLSHRDRLLMMGSCFAENIGEKLLSCGFNIDLNPFGILYNPLSIAQALTEILDNKIYCHKDLFEHDGLWHSFMHHGSFSNSEEETVLQHINERITSASSRFKETDFLLLTFGTSYVYRKDGLVVSNCHKISESEFNRTRICSQEIVDTYISLINRIIGINKDIKIIFTVSPIRYIRDGLHESQLSKAVLLTAIDELQKLYPQVVSYFPAYEIVIDELRDYRFYADDMVHPSPLAVEYVWERFAQTYLSEETLAIAKECENIKKSLSHRPLHPDDKAYQIFLGQITLKINRLKEKYPYLELKL